MSMPPTIPLGIEGLTTSDGPPGGSLPTVTSDVAEARGHLDRWGYCLLGGALSPEDLAAARRRLVEQAAGEAAAGIATFDDGAAVSRRGAKGANQRLRNLMNKGREFQRLALRPGVTDLLEHVLGERFLMTSYSANITAPGCPDQALHQDQGYVTRPYPAYPIVTNVVWTLDDVNATNGGTRVVPGSHLWDEPLPESNSPMAVTLEAPAGTAILVDGRTYHGAGANQSEARRHVLLVNYCRAWVRQQDNPFLGLAPDVEADLSPDLRRLMGFKTWGTLGSVGDPGAVDDEGFVRRPAHLVGRLS
jgi:ectoine hydroxylase-related dioxygenase (phytanoyl-CoA dioxygenase family)